MKKNARASILLAAGLIAAVMAGCGSAAGNASAGDAGADPALHGEAASQQEAGERQMDGTQQEDVSQQEDGTQQEGDSQGDIDSGEEAGNKAEVIQTAAKDDRENSAADGDLGSSTLLAGNVIDDPKLVQAAVDGLKKYFGVQVDRSQFDISVDFFEAYDDSKESYSVYFSVPENEAILSREGSFGPDGSPLPEIEDKLKPEYIVSFSDTRQIEAMTLSNMGWQERKTPVTMKEIKEMAGEFLLSNNLISDKKLIFMGSGFGDRSSMVIYQNGKSGAVQVVVDTSAGKISGFSYMTAETAQMLLSPVEEGFGVG